jgi:diguanylate cyclase (GGDEF)-like protein
MELDVRTMFVVTIAVAAILGLLLLYAWQQQRKIAALVWWGGAHFVACVGVLLIGARGLLGPFWTIEISNALLFVAAGMVWNGARLFDGNRSSPIGVLGGAAAWLLAANFTDFMAAAHGPVVFSSMIIAAYTFATAIEFWNGRHENLLSRLPLVVMLAMHGVLYLARVPLALFLPGARSEAFFSVAWFGVIGLESLLYMIATAFVLLAMAKERTELEHKVAATTDALTGIPNRRAFFDSAARHLQQRSRAPQPVAALLFDLDRFKSINDRYGHAVGDRVLRTFTDIAVLELRSTDLVGRLGGEEFGALLFGAEAGGAIATAERIRQRFAASFANAKQGHAVTVSVGVSALPAEEIADIDTLISRADEALYVAKARGRNRVEAARGYAERASGRSGREAANVRIAGPSLVPADAEVAAGAARTMAEPARQHAVAIR